MCDCTVFDASLKGVVSTNTCHCFDKQQGHDEGQGTEEEEGKCGSMVSQWHDDLYAQ